MSSSPARRLSRCIAGACHVLTLADATASAAPVEEREVALSELSVAVGAPVASVGDVGGLTGIGGLSAPADSASAGTITGAAINSRPVTRPGEVLEAVPGLIVTQHSGEGKANQYFLRGFNLDHGTDIALFVDGMPVNLRTHAHGQGYADLNFLISELVGAVDYHKGPYFVRDGDFASAGLVRIDYLDTVNRNLALTSIGSFGYRRALSIASAPLGDGNLLVAVEAQVYNGPWVVPDAVRKINGVTRYSQGTVLDGFSVTGMAYATRYTATNQIPERAVVEGLIGRYGTLNPTDGGDTVPALALGPLQPAATRPDRRAPRPTWSARSSTCSTTSRMSSTIRSTATSSTSSTSSTIASSAAARRLHIVNGDLFGRPLEVEVGVQTRTDSIRVGLFNTTDRRYRSTVLDDRVLEASAAIYLDTRVRWTDWLRTSIGVRADGYSASVASDTPAQFRPGARRHRQPEARPRAGPLGRYRGLLELRRRLPLERRPAGSPPRSIRRARCSTPCARPSWCPRPATRSESAIARSRGSRRAWLCSGSISPPRTSFKAIPARPSRAARPAASGSSGPTATLVTPWLSLDGDLTITNVRFSDDDALGNRVPEAPTTIAAAGLTFGEGPRLVRCPSGCAISGRAR